MKQRKLWTRCRAGAGLVAAMMVPLGLVAEQAGSALGQQTLGRAYWHVFAAYAVAWILVFGWAVSMGRRLGRVEDRLSGE